MTAELTPNLPYKDVLSGYFPEAPEVEITQSFKESVIAVALNGEEYVIRRYPRELSEERVEFSIKLQNEIVKRLGIDPAIMATMSNQLFVEVGQFRYDLSPFIENYMLDNQETRELDHFFESMGAFIGSLHTSFAELDIAESNILDALLYIHPTESDHISQLQEEYQENGIDEEWHHILSRKQQLRDIYSFVEERFLQLPTNIVHGDLHLENVLFDHNGNIIGLIDFVRAGEFFKCYEVFRAFIQINKFFNETEIESTHLKKYLEEYLSTGSLEDIELQTMLSLYTYAQAADISFLDVETIKEAGSAADYGKFRSHSLLYLHGEHQRLQNVIDGIRRYK